MTHAIEKQFAQDAFLETLAETGDIELAARAGNRTSRCFYYWRKDDPEFFEQWAVAERQSAGMLAREAVRRAKDGVRKHLYHQGRPVLVVDDKGELVHAYEINYSDTLLMMLMKARDPETYCDKVRAARIQRAWDKADGRAGQGATVPAETVIALLQAAAAAKAQQPEAPTDAPNA